jgi:hypothetical protein
VVEVNRPDRRTRQVGPDRRRGGRPGRAGRDATAAPKRRDGTRLSWPTQCTPPRRHCKQSPTSFSCSRPSSPWLTSGWPPSSVGPLPGSSKLLAIGNDHAGQLLVTAGQHPERLRGEAAFAHLCGVAPIPARSGKTRRHRLHRGGDRDANRALHLAVVVRMRFCPRTRAYVEGRTKEGLSKPEIMRCVKRYLAREVYHALVADFEALHAT